MNKIILMGRLTRDPEVRYGGAQNMAIARFSIAVDRRYKREGQPEADFFNVTAFGKLGEFVEKYLHKGVKILLEGEMQNNNYESKKHPGEMVYGFNIIANSIEFAESKKTAEQNGTYSAPSNNSGASADNSQPAPSGDAPDDSFMNIPDGIDDELPFA